MRARISSGRERMGKDLAPSWWVSGPGLEVECEDGNDGTGE